MDKERSSLKEKHGPIDGSVGRKASGLLDLTPAQYRVLGIVAASRGNPITKSDIAKVAGCAETTVDRAMRRLREEGLVETAENRDEKGAQIGNSYLLRA